MEENCLRAEQRVSLELKSLYLSYGYREYKLSGFEEYSLYAENQNFLSGKDVITFHVGGKLLALRPDVTLSIVKNIKTDGETQKLFYDEKVYRKNDCGGFTEVSQLGAEVIGKVDLAAEAELMTLMRRTLSAAGKNYLLDVSHIGVVVSLFDRMNLNAVDRSFVLDCLNRKALHEFRRFAEKNAVDTLSCRAMEGLIRLPASPNAALLFLKQSGIPEIQPYVDELEQLISLVGAENVNVNFSVDGDADYYNGLMFKGYVEGAPRAVLSGGRYDKLLSKFGKNAQAIGFALYLGELYGLSEDAPSLPDVAVVYSASSVKNAYRTAEELRKQGWKVLMTHAVDRFNGKIVVAEEDHDSYCSP